MGGRVRGGFGSGWALHSTRHTLSAGDWGILWLSWSGCRDGQENSGVSPAEGNPETLGGLAPCLSVSVRKGRSRVWHSDPGKKLQGRRFQLRSGNILDTKNSLLMG